jgi:SAM-dependent methyltransferase
VAVDVSRRALEVARRDTPDGTAWVEGEAPEVLDEVDGPLDLVVLSEVGYFLRPVELWLTLGRLLERLAPGGELVLVHWRHPTRDIPLDGPSVHAQVRAVCAPWSTLVLVEDDVLVDAYVVPR